MLKQKVFFFVPRVESGGDMAGSDDLRAMAADYVRIYGESCLADPETPAFVRHMLGRSPAVAIPRAG